ncbi:acyltransferase family protein [Pararhodobacter oceanensis]|uniref:Acyltransferase 3 domain-containing protein n=1 Tax=Pararhodobacter oceanensis TaxID=2172121 RepID=A0A2T8HS43_9RHOB|nr:acyltransferase [Pararhodobacter oceanensis]PVH28251.1 hypothetical protein DDE20_14235 [Pararhodobacter oceanensis]
MEKLHPCSKTGMASQEKQIKNRWGPAAAYSQHAFPKTNNFDLIRLVAAMQVVFVHAVEHLNLPINGTLHAIIYNLPGVPIFFVISGFLISASYVRNDDIWNYLTNRALRIFPALWGCLAVSFLSAWLLGGISQSARIADIGLWFLAQSTFLQFYNPDFLRGYGIGVLNGSLWTIPVEIQFYILTPIVIYLYFRLRLAFTSLFIVFLGINSLNSFSFFDDHLPRLVAALIGVTFLPWLALFLIGVLIQLNYHRVRFLLEGRALWWIVGYTGMISLTLLLNIDISGNRLLLPWSVVLAFTTCSRAFTRKDTSQSLIGRNDISYGVYIYHMLAINAVISLGFVFNWWAMLLALGITLFCSTVSWAFIEEPALRLKPTSLRKSGRVD